MGRGERWLRLTPALVGVVGAVYIVLVATASRPIADDWWLIGDARHWSFGHYMNFYLGADSDRASQFGLAWVAARLLGFSAVNVTPLVLLVLALALAARTAWAIGRLIGADLDLTAAVALGLLAVVGCVATTPSLFDTVGWFNAVVIYLAAAVTALAVVCWVLSHTADARDAGPRPVVIAVAGLAAIAAGFNEIVGTCLTLAGALSLVTVTDLSAAGPVRARLRWWLSTITLGAGLGTAANVLGPGSRSRAHVQHARVALGAAARTAWHNLTFLRADIHDGVLLMAVATGIVAWQLLGPLAPGRPQRWCGVWALFLLIVPWLVTAALTAWGGSTESGDRSPFRAGFIATASVALAIVLCVVLALSLYSSLLSQGRATLLALLLVATGTVGIAHKYDGIIRAEQLRATALNGRAASVRRQLAAHRSTIELVPAPLLTVFTQAYDLSFAPLDGQRGGWVQAVRDLYDIPARDRVAIEATQPRGYCLPGVTAPWVGVRSCQEPGASPGER